jgi:hypothetical protein
MSTESDNTSKAGTKIPSSRARDYFIEVSIDNNEMKCGMCCKLVKAPGGRFIALKFQW